MLSISHKLPWMRSGTEFSQFLRVFLPTLSNSILRQLLFYNQSVGCVCEKMAVELDIGHRPTSTLKCKIYKKMSRIFS